MIVVTRFAACLAVWCMFLPEPAITAEEPLSDENSIVHPRLQRLYDEMIEQKRKIRHLPPEAKMEQRREFRAKKRCPEDIELIVQTCKNALDSRPVDWQQLRMALSLARFGVSDARIVQCCKSVIELPAPEKIMQARKWCIMTAIVALGCQGLPSAEEFLIKCVDGKFWEDGPIYCPEEGKSDSREDFRKTAAFAICGLPYETARSAMKQLARKYPIRRGSFLEFEKQLGHIIDMLREDVELRHQGLPPVIDGLRD